MMVDSVKYKKAEVLRRKGKSYSFISDELGVSKSTISNWFSEESWSNQIKLDLNCSRLKMARKNLVMANFIRKENQLKRRKQYLDEANFEFKKLISKPLFLIGLGIYWGEGDKTNNGRVAVINTDPELLKIIVNFYRQCLGVVDSNLRVGLFIYEDIDRETIIDFWSNILNIPRQQFIKIQVLKSRSRLTKHKSKYGICSLYFSSTRLSVKIHEWIRLLSIHGLTNLRV
ncbi:MAG: hypothetical protein WDA13_01605 [Candidatus Shapirobacteria bacterium]